ncbi:MAG: hypothetical protein RR115_02180 [Hydrogenoanaerobacterium sp.]
MVDLLSQWLGFTGINFIPPENLASFFPYFFNCLLAFCLIAGFFQLVRFAIGGIAKGGRYL